MGYTDLKTALDAVVKTNGRQEITGANLNGVMTTLLQGVDVLDRANPADTSGMNGVVLKKNKTFAEQVTGTNTIYEIRDEFDLGGSRVTIPSGSVLVFNGGKLKNGTLVGTSTQVVADNVKIFDLNLSLDGSFLNEEFIVSWYGATPSLDKNNPVDAYAGIQKALDVNVANGFKSVKFPVGLWYISQTMVMSVIKNIHLEGLSNHIRLAITADKSCAVIFTNLDIDLLVINQLYPDDTSMGLSICGGQFDASLVSGYSHSAIRFTDSNGETKLNGVNIKTDIHASPNSLSTGSKGIYFDLTHGGYVTMISTECTINFFNYGFIDNIVSPSWATNLTDRSVISCAVAFKLTTLYEVFCYGAIQAVAFFSTNTLSIIDISSSGVVAIHGFIWDVNVGSGSQKTQRYAIKGYPTTRIYLLPEVLRHLDKDTIANAEYITIATPDYNPNRRVAGAYRADGYSEIENTLVDDGSFTITSECATGMLFRWVENAFSTKASRGARFDFQTVSESDAYIKVNVTFNAVTFINLFGFIIHNYQSPYCSSFKKCRVRMFNNASTEVYNQEIDLTQTLYNTYSQFTLPLHLETAIKSMEFHFYAAQFNSGQTYGELLSIFARARGAGNSANHKFITTEGKGLGKIYNSAGVNVENFELPKSGTTGNRPTTGLYVGFAYFDTNLQKTIYYKNATTWVDADGWNSDYKRRGATTDRPTPTSAEYGFTFYDTTLRKMILWNGTGWTNMDGSAL